MTKSYSEQEKARDLQHRTGWRYQECLRCVKGLTAEQIDALICERFGIHPIGRVDTSRGSVVDVIVQRRRKHQEKRKEGP